jgi:hypothetical protein
MPIDDAVASFFIGIVVGFIVATGIGVAAVEHYKSKSVDHGAAQYNSNTGEFEWKKVNNAK